MNTRFRLLWFVSALFIVYGTSLPFEFVAETEFALDRLSRVPMQVSVPPGSRRGIADVVQNVLLFVPFGVFGVLSLQPHTARAVAIPIVTLLGFLLSVGVETIQLFTVTRSSSVTDVVMNTAGALGGALAAPFASAGARWVVVTARARGLVATTRSLYLVMFCGALLAASAWHPFDVALSVGGVMSDVRALMADPLQAGMFRDEPGDALRYGLFAAAVTFVLQESGVRGAAVRGAALTALVAVALESSQILVLSRAPGLYDVLVGIAGAIAGAAVASSPVARWPAGRRAVLIGSLVWVSAAALSLAPFAWSDTRREFLWMPFASYQQSPQASTISNIVEILITFAPVGFALARAVPGSRVWVSAAGVAALMMWPLEYLQGWTPDRIPDVTGIGVAVVGALCGAWAGGAAAGVERQKAAVGQVWR